MSDKGLNRSDLEGILRLLDASTLQVEQAADGLVLRRAECSEMRGVSVRPCFPLTQPGRFLVFCDAEGQEIGMLEDAEALPARSRQVLLDELGKQHFLPVITRVDAIYQEFQIPIWQVETSAGPRRLELKSNHDVHRLQNGGVYVRDAEGNGYLIPDCNRLDAASRDLIELYV